MNPSQTLQERELTTEEAESLDAAIVRLAESPPPAITGVPMETLTAAEYLERVK